DLAGRIADEVKIGGSANPDMVQQMRTWGATSATAAGRGTGAGRVCAGGGTGVGGGGERGRAGARREGAMSLAAVARLDPTVQVEEELLVRLRALLAEGRAEEAGGLLSDDLLDRFCLAGTPSQVVEHTLRLAAAGADRVEFGTPHGLTGSGGIQLLGSVVLPAVRSELAAV